MDELTQHLLDEIEHIQKCASGEIQIADDDTEGMKYIDQYAQAVLRKEAQPPALAETEWPTHCIHGHPVNGDVWCPKCKALGESASAERSQSSEELVQEMAKVYCGITREQMYTCGDRSTYAGMAAALAVARPVIEAEVRRGYHSEGEAVTVERAYEAAQRLINSHFGNVNRARCSIPADPRNDDDLVLMRFINQVASNRARARKEGGMKLCQEVIWLSKTSSTYCMREAGHDGEHSIGVIVQSREECALIPQRVSCTETAAAYYIRVREASEIVALRVTKKSLHVEVSNTHVAD